MAELHVACAVWGDLYAHSAAMLRSVAAHAGGARVHVHYLHGPAFPRPALEAIGVMVSDLGGRFTPYDVGEERVAGLALLPQFTPAVWYRIFLPELVAGADRVLYLDVDTLATDDLTPLWTTPLDGHHLAAVTNVLMPHHQDRPASLGLDPRAYFNSGVLLMNLELMRRDATTDALLAYAREQGDALAWGDQDALNAVLGSTRLALHPRWNAMNALRFPWAVDVHGAEAIAEARANPGIRHFEGPDDNKPWHRGCALDDRELYLEHRRGTPWPRVRLEGPRRAPRPSRELVLYTLIGGSGVALDLVLFLLLFNAAGVHEVAATAISTTAGITNNFVLNALFNFRRRDDLLRRFARFYAVGLLGLALVAGLLLVFSTWLGVDANIVKVLSLPLVLALQYTLNARWTFRA